MKYTLFIVLFLLSFSSSFSQSSFTICDENNIYGVDNYQLRADIENFKEAKKTPEYKGGTLEIRRYFNRIKLNPEKSNGQVFRSYISFIINCEGQVGNYKILGNHPDSLKILEDEILQKLKAMPNLWSIAEHKGKKVDCYQVLVFTVLNGSFSNIYYK